AMLLTPEGRIAGKYSYSPFGNQLKARVDNIPPSIQQIRLELCANDKACLDLEPDEELDNQGLDGPIKVAPIPAPLAGTTSAKVTQPLAIEVEQPIQEGRRAKRRVRITIADLPEAGTELELEVGVAAIADLFQNQLAQPFTLRFTVPAAGTGPQILLDTANPQVDEVRLSDGHLEVSFTEQPDATAAAAALRIDGASVSWSLLPESYTLRSEQPLAAGAHVIRIEQGAPLDHAGKGVLQTFEQSFTVDGVQPIAAIFEAPEPREVPLETLANRFTFQGRPYDAETGLFYFRNRYYDPELGRFITPDPLGYVDGPSVYAFASYSPFSLRDPLGLAPITPDDVKTFRREVEREKNIQDLRRQLAWTRLRIFLDSRLARYERGSLEEREEMGRLLYGLGFGQADVTAIMGSLLGVSGICVGPTAQLHCHLTAQTAGFPEVSIAALDLILALGGAAEGVANIADDLILSSRLGRRLAAVPRARSARFVVNSAGDVLDTERITIPEGKFGYLLTNPSKSGVFADSMGFSREALDPALRSHLIDNFGNPTPFVPMVGGGSKFSVTGPMVGPSGQKWTITSVWGIDPDGTLRLITATP
ncbi:MAG: RHS repeat-associated core domain-containing protein, partial [Thermoanaerobaculia bacterium]|nr:RHS repeat-associated core domain-containing protein [Thermoanaerobaculia bacterium]